MTCAVSSQIATSAGLANYENLKFSEMDSKLSFWNLMVRLRAALGSAAAPT